MHFDLMKEKTRPYRRAFLEGCLVGKCGGTYVLLFQMVKIIVQFFLCIVFHHFQAKEYVHEDDMRKASHNYW